MHWRVGFKASLYSTWRTIGMGFFDTPSLKVQMICAFWVRTFYFDMRRHQHLLQLPVKWNWEVIVFLWRVRGSHSFYSVLWTHTEVIGFLRGLGGTPSFYILRHFRPLLTTLIFIICVLNLKQGTRMRQRLPADREYMIQCILSNLKWFIYSPKIIIYSP